jgi:hypothetical protein
MNIQKRDGQFGDVGDDIRAAFQKGVETDDKWLQEINDNIMYYAASILDP